MVCNADSWEDLLIIVKQTEGIHFFWFLCPDLELQRLQFTRRNWNKPTVALRYLLPGTIQPGSVPVVLGTADSCNLLAE